MTTRRRARVIVSLAVVWLLTAAGFYFLQWAWM